MPFRRSDQVVTGCLQAFDTGHRKMLADGKMAYSGRIWWEAPSFLRSQSWMPSAWVWWRSQVRIGAQACHCSAQGKKQFGTVLTSKGSAGTGAVIINLQPA